MVKKRKSGPITFPRVKVEVKSEDKSIPGIDDARDRLKGALQELLDLSDESSVTSSDDDLTEPEPVKPTPVKKERTSAPSTPKLSKTMKRRRRREMVNNNAFHHTFVMKMFDRSVDLAQFEENSPLYAVCRGWMANQPRNASLVARQPPLVTPERAEDEPVKDDARSDEGEVYEDVWVMPEPIPLPTDPEELCKLRIPSPVPREKTEPDGGKGTPSREALLGDHLQHWGRVNRRWRSVAQRNELRYKASLQLLRTMYKRIFQ